jgi:hypothetical protein
MGTVAAVAGIVAGIVAAAAGAAEVIDLAAEIGLP